MNYRLELSLELSLAWNFLRNRLFEINMDYDETALVDEGFQVVQGRKRRRVTSSSSSEAGTEVSKGAQTKVLIRTETGKLNPVRVQQQVSDLLGRPDVKIISRNNLLIIIAKNDVETTKLSLIKNLDGVAANAHVAAKPKYCIIGVPVNVDDETIKLGTGCESATRIFKSIGGSKVASPVVILSFQGKVPDRVKLGYLSFKVKPFVREPIRCYKCNAYGHIAANCANKTKCPRCLGEHSLKECPNKEAEKRCATCNSTNHHTGQAACPQRKIEKDAILRRATKNFTHVKSLTVAKNKVVSAETTPAPKVLTATPSSSLGKQANAPTKEHQNKNKRKRKRKAKKAAAATEEPAATRSKPEEITMNISAIAITKFINEITQQVNQKYNRGSAEQLEEIFTIIAKTFFRCMYEASVPEAAKAANKNCPVPHTDQHE